MKTKMSWAILVGLIVCQLWTSLFSQTNTVSFPPAALPTAASHVQSTIQVVSVTLPTGAQQIVLVDTLNRTMAVYQIPSQDGRIQLKSVRQLASDLTMEEFNGLSPLPSELRQLR